MLVIVGGVLGGMGLAGCGQEAAPLAPGGSPLAAREGAADAPVVAALPVRVSRSFFESAELSGQVRVADAVRNEAVEWRLGAAGLGGDRVGCAVYASGAEVCFKLMGDVDSAGVNSREMSVSGLDTLLGGAPCPGAHWVASLSSASRYPETVPSREVTRLAMRLQARPDQASCAAPAVELELAMTR